MTKRSETLEQLAERMARELEARREQAWPMRAALIEFRRKLQQRKIR